MRRHVLVGAGPAAISAAETIRATDPAASITLVTADPHCYYSRPGLAYYLAKEIPEDRLFPFPTETFDRLGIERITDRAIDIDVAAHTLALAGGAVLPYDRLLLATGSSAIGLGVPGADLDGVVKLDDMQDARQLIRRSSRAKRAVVIGGGITALEIVEGLRERHVHVHYFLRRGRYWANVLSETESQIIEDALRSRGVEIHFYTELAEVLGTNGRVVAVQTTAGERIACDLIAVAVGVLPNKQLAVEAGIACDRGVLVDEYLRADAPDIYAAGDLAEVLDVTTGRRAIEVLWSSAVEKGRIAGANMAGEATLTFQKRAPLNVTRLAGRRITIIGTVGSGADSDLQGIARGDSETWRRLGDAAVLETAARGAHVRLALSEGRLLGAVVMGEQSLSFPLQELMAADADITPIRAQLLAPSADVGGLLESFYSQWRGHRD